MARATGLMDPANSAKSTGSFKEGFVRIDKASYKVHKAKPGEGEAPVPATKFCWQVTRLAEGGTEPLVNEHDDEPEDLGTDEGTEGDTIFLVANDWRPNEKSGLVVLTASMVAAGVKAEYLNRCWGPDWVGCIFEIKQKKGDKGSDGREFSYKVVTKVVVGPGGGKKGKASPAQANGNSETNAILAPIIQSLSLELDGTSITRKALLNRVRASLDAANVDSKLLIPILSLLKDDKWLSEHADTFDYKLDTKNNSVVFGNVPF